MPRMAVTPSRSTQTDEAHEAEVAQQLQIAEDIAPEAPAAGKDEVPVAQEAAAAAKVTLRSVEELVGEYPLTVSVVGSEDIVFDSASTTAEVDPQVAEQVTYLTNVEVVA